MSIAGMSIAGMSIAGMSIAGTVFCSGYAGGFASGFSTGAMQGQNFFNCLGMGIMGGTIGSASSMATFGLGQMISMPSSLFSSVPRTQQS